MAAKETEDTKKPKGLLLHFDKWDLLEPFEDDMIGKIIKALFLYGMKGISADESTFGNKFAFAVYKNFKSCYEANQEKYEQKCRKNQQIAKEAAERRRQNKELLEHRVNEYERTHANATDHEHSPANTNTKTNPNTRTNTDIKTNTKSNLDTITNQHAARDCYSHEGNIICAETANITTSALEADPSEIGEDDEGMDGENEDELYGNVDDSDTGITGCIQSNGLKEGKEKSSDSTQCEAEDLSYERMFVAYGCPDCDKVKTKDIWDKLPPEERRKALAFIPRYFSVREGRYRKHFINYLSYMTWNQPLEVYGNKDNRTDYDQNGTSDNRNAAEARKAIESLLDYGSTGIAREQQG